MCCVNEGNLRYIAVVKDENCSDWKIERSLQFYDLKLSLRHFSYTHYGLGFRYWLHTFLPYLEYAVKCRMIFKNPRSGLVFPVEENMQKYSKRF